MLAPVLATLTLGCQQEDPATFNKQTHESESIQDGLLEGSESEGLEDSLGMPAPKRVGPPDVQPLVIDGIRIEAIHWGKARGLEQNGGYIEAFKHPGNETLWVRKIYHIDYKEALESDVQDLFIESIMKGTSEDQIIIIDENKREYQMKLP